MVNGGALRYYAEISHLLRSGNGGFRSEPHDFFALANGPDDRLVSLIRSLGPDDVLVSSIGPYAHLYHYLRERHGGRFRILRDVRTSSWAGYLMQERMAAPYTRPGDTILFPSDFCRSYFLRLFPGSLGPENTRVCYPLCTWFPPRVRRVESPSLRVGYLGRISGDKNMTQLLSIFSRLLGEGEASAHLHLAGPVEGQILASLAKRRLEKAARSHAIPADRIHYAGNLDHARIWGFLANIDVLLFPAMASVESLGRILLEASRAGVKVVAARYAAAPELLGEGSLARTHYHVGPDFDTVKPFSLGRVSESDAVAKIASARMEEDVSRWPRYQADAFLEALRPSAPWAPEAILDPVVRAFLDSVRVTGLEPPGFDEGMRTLARAREFFRRYNDNSLIGRMKLALGMEASARGLDRSLRWRRVSEPQGRMLLAQVRQHCHYQGFTPRLRLEPSAGDRILLDPVTASAQAPA